MKSHNIALWNVVHFTDLSFYVNAKFSIIDSNAEKKLTIQ
ncbi:hypothetical protein COK_2175 [Mannheimia haemolytica serotype A2 str. BOVINE]|nr:hypothetical protein COK_2175 [Mannheimia haemolytica serotype A2 str. BOVINE]